MPHRLPLDAEWCSANHFVRPSVMGLHLSCEKKAGERGNQSPAKPREGWEEVDAENHEMQAHVHISPRGKRPHAFGYIAKLKKRPPPCPVLVPPQLSVMWKCVQVAAGALSSSDLVFLRGCLRLSSNQLADLKLPQLGNLLTPLIYGGPGNIEGLRQRQNALGWC